MKKFNWSVEKNNYLKETREISFEDIVSALDSGGELDNILHYNQDKYPSQRIFIVFYKDYIYSVPFVETKEEVFLKTIIPSRKLKKLYIINKS